MKNSISTLMILIAVVAAGCDRGTGRTSQSPAGASATPASITAAPTLGVANLIAENGSEPAVTDGGGDKAFIVYVQHNGKDGSDVVFQRLSTDGKPAGDKVRVNDKPNAAKSWKGDPPTIALGPHGAVYVGWTRRYGGQHSRGTDLMISVSKDRGQTFAPAVKVNDDSKPASHGMHSLAVTAAGRVVMAWLDERNVKNSPHEMNTGSGSMSHQETEPNSEVFTALSDDGGRTFSQNKRIASEVCPCCKTTLLAAADGTVYASWR